MEKNLQFTEDCKRHLEHLFVQKDESLWENGIMEVACKMLECSGTKW